MLVTESSKASSNSVLAALSYDNQINIEGSGFFPKLDGRRQAMLHDRIIGG